MNPNPDRGTTYQTWQSPEASPVRLKEIKDCHDEAMEYLDRALLAKSRGQISESEYFFHEAFVHERIAADLVAPFDLEPSRSVIHRSAANLALQCQDFAEAARLAGRGTRGHAPAQVLNELREIISLLPPRYVSYVDLTDELDEEFEARLTDPLDRCVRFLKSSERDKTKSLVEEFLDQVLQGVIVVSNDIGDMIAERIAQIDHLMSVQLKEVLHHPAFQKLEATWRGVNYLVHQSMVSSSLKIKLLNVNKQDLTEDRGASSGFRRSALYKKICDEELFSVGGAPFTALIGDYEFSGLGQDVGLLNFVAEIAAAAHSPFLTAASPAMFNLMTFTNLGHQRDLAEIFRTGDYIRWNQFRESEASRYIALTLPRILMREPYGPHSIPVRDFAFDEGVDGTEHNKYLWGNAAYALGARLSDAFRCYGWCARICGLEGGGVVEDLPVHCLDNSDGGHIAKCSTEVAITGRREIELADQGFAPLSHSEHSHHAVFLRVSSAQFRKTYIDPIANALASLSTQIPYVLAVSRFAHYIRCMVRDRPAHFMSRSDCENWLNTWVSNYVSTDDSPSLETKARRPLREAHIEVVEALDKPGTYRAVAFLRPHFQLKDPMGGIRLVVDLPQPLRK